MSNAAPPQKERCIGFGVSHIFLATAAGAYLIIKSMQITSKFEITGKLDVTYSYI
jgi:hypothetical protein